MRIINLFKIDFDKKRIYGLDILRALAILFVVIEHGIGYMPQKLHVKIISRFLVFDGVSIFFILSGFLIGGILIKVLEKHPPTFRTLLSFWKRRWLRTLPNYYFILLLLALILPFLFKHSMGNPFQKISYVFFLQNLYYPHPGFFGEAWSLSVEEWFYLIIPSLIFILSLFFNPKSSILTIAIAVIIIVTAFRYYRYMNFPAYSFSYDQWDLNFRKQVLPRLDSLMYGLIGAFFSFYHKATWVRYKKTLLILGILMLLVQQYTPFFIGENLGLYECVFSFSLTSLGALLLLPFLSEYKTGKGFIYVAMTYISLISYSMYLLNFSVMRFYMVGFVAKCICYMTHLPVKLIELLCYFPLTIIGSIILYKYFEKPIMDLRERIK